MSFVDSLKKGLFGSEDDYDDQYMDDGPQMVNNNNGQIKRVANSTFIITPYNVDIMGDLLDELENNGAFY